MRWLRLGAIGAFCTGILAVLQGCTSKEFIILLAVLLGLQTCSGPATSVTSVIDTNGGIIALGNIKIEIPAGFFPDSTRVTLSKRPATALTTNSNILPLGGYYSIIIEPMVSNPVPTNASVTEDSSRGIAAASANSSNWIITISDALTELNNQVSITIDEYLESLKLFVYEGIDATKSVLTQVVKATVKKVQNAYEVTATVVVDIKQATFALIGYVDNCENAVFGQYTTDSLDPVPGLSAQARKAIVFVHGITATPQDWDFFIGKLRVESLGYKAYTYFYCTAQSVLESGNHLAQVLSTEPSIRDLEEIDIVAHSMGGLVTKAAILYSLPRDTSPWLGKLRKVVMLGTPNDGTPLAEKALSDPVGLAQVVLESNTLKDLLESSPLVAYLLVDTPGLRDMVPWSPALTQLGASAIFDQADFMTVAGIVSTRDGTLEKTTIFVPYPNDGAVNAWSAWGIDHGPNFGAVLPPGDQAYPIEENHFGYTTNEHVWDIIQLFIDRASSLPPAPSDLNAIVDFPLIVLSWSDNSTNEIGFRIHFSGNLMANLTAPDTVGADQTSYTHYFGIVYNTQYCYEIAAFNDFGESAKSNKVCVTTPLNPVQQFTLTVNKEGTGTGSVVSTPVGIGCLTLCLSAQADFNVEQVVTLDVIADSSSTFEGWTGDADCSDGSVTMDADKHCTANFAAVAQSSMIAFSCSNDICIMPSQGGVVTNLTNANGTSDLDPQWSPDGSKLVFHCSGDICVVNSASGVVTNLTSGNGTNDRYPQWSPDGSKIAYACGTDICVIPTSGGQIHNLTSTNGRSDYVPQWSPDGSEIVFACGGDICVIPTSGGEVTILATSGFVPQWSPDGRKIVFHCGHNICVVDSGGGTITNLTINWVPPGSPPGTITLKENPQWSPDGSKIVFACALGICVIPSRGGAITSVATNDQIADATPQWSPDGSKIAFDCSYYTVDICVVPSVGGVVTNLTNINGTNDLRPQWSQN